MAKKKYLEESERKLIESVNNAYIPTDWDEFEKRYHEMERYGDGKPRKVDKEKMEYIEDGLVSRGIEGNQLSSLLSTIVEESGGNPFSVDDSGKFRGLIQFSKERYPEKDFNRDKKAGWKKAVDNQLDAIVDHLNEYGGDYGFLDGGDGSGYMTGEEAKDAFWGRDSDIENVTRALTYGFVRPGDRSGTTENRTRVARLINEIIQPPVETPDVLEFDYDGKHYRAETPEEVTPEMRRALMLSKLVGEKNRVELQDPLYTTFDEAYGRAKGKGASVFMWNGKKYSTKEDGGEVKDMEKFGKILESLYNEDVERVRNGEQAQYFGALNDKPLENVYPEFDLISKPANMVSKGADMIDRPLGVISGDIKEDVYGGLEKMAKYTGKVDDYVRRLYYKGTKSVFDKLPEIVKPLARQVFSKYYNWRRLTVPETIRLSREIFGGEDEPESFDAAFKAARDQGLDKFKWNGNEYSTEIKEEGGETNSAEFSLPEVNPKRPDGGLSKRISEDDILALVLSSNANFVNRLKQEGRSTIPDWKVKGNIATHKLSAEIGEDGRVYVYPNVQEIDGKLKDFTDPKYGYSNEGRWDAMDNAIKHNDYVVFPDIESAVWFTENYKNKGWFPEFSDGGLSRLAPRDNTSVGRPGPADVQPVKPSAAARENPVVPFVASLLPGIGDVIDAHDFIQAARDKNMVGMALAAAGFIPLVGDAFQEAARFARGRRNSYIRYDAPQRRNDIKESDEELLRKMPDYARPGYPAMEALDVHRRRLSDGAYEQRTGQGGAEARQELEGFAETFPGIYDRIFDLDYINEDDMDAARRVIEIIDKQPKGSAGTMSDEGVVKRLNDIKQRLVRSSPAFAEGTKGNAGIISLDNWSDFFMDEAYRSGISHELDHAVYLNTPEETIKELSGKVDGWFDSSRIEDKGVRDYISRPMELLARGTQIKDFYGLTDNAEKVTPEMLKFAARHYADNVMDNQMTEFFNGIKDWGKAAEWISKYSTATLPAIAVSKLLQDGKEKDEYPANKRHGGPISEDGSIGDDYILDDGGRSLYKRSEYIKGRLLSKYNLLPEESNGIIKGLIEKSSLDEKFYDPKHKSYGIGQWSGKDLKEFVSTYKDGGLIDQIDFLAKKYWSDSRKSDIEPGVFDDHRWVVKRIGNEEFYTNSPLLKTLPSMSREDVALSLLPPELWPGVLKRKEDVTGKSARRHFVRGGEVSELQDYIYDRLTKEHGIAPIQAIGIVANLTQESALDYDALGDNGRSYGIQQWQGDRRKNLFEFAKKRGRDEPALDDQVDFLVEEYKGDGFLFPTRGENMYKTGKTDKDMFDYFQYSKLDFDNAANIYDSTRAWAQGFGRGNKNFLNMDRRFHIAKTLSSRYNIDAGGQSFYTDMGYKDEWGSPVPEVAVSAEKRAAQDDWMEKYGNKMLASILAGDGEGGDTHVTNNYYVNEEGLSEDEKRNAAEVRELQQKQQAQELLASIIDGIKLDIKGVTEVRKR